MGVVSTEKEVLVIGLNKVSYKVSQLSLSRNSVTCKEDWSSGVRQEREKVGESINEHKHFKEEMLLKCQLRQRQMLPLDLVSKKTF